MREVRWEVAEVGRGPGRAHTTTTGGGEAWGGAERGVGWRWGRAGRRSRSGRRRRRRQRGCA